MKQTAKIQITLNSRLVPLLVGVLLLMQLTFPFKGWQILLIGLGGLWLISYLWVQILARSLRLKREMRFGWAHVGDRLEERFTLTNLSIVPALWVEITDHSTMPGYSAGRVTGVDNNGQNRWYTQGVCHQRGVFTLGPTTLHTGDPFGLYTVSLHYPDSFPITITPPIVSLPAIEVAPGGRAGEGRPRPNTFERTVSAFGVRQYVPGDSLNLVHWRTTARQGSLFVRLFDSTPSGDWWIILDLDEKIQVGQGYESTQEHAIILAASLADRGLRLGRAVGLVAHGNELAWHPPQTGNGQRQQILRTLSLAHPSKHSLAELLTHIRPSLGHISSLVIITVATQKSRWVEALVPLLRRGAVATVLLLDPASFGGADNTQGMPALLANLGITSYTIPKELLDRPEARPGQQGQWQWRVSPTGRAIAVNRPEDLSWKRLI